VCRLPPHQSRRPRLTPSSRPPRWAPRKGSWRQTPRHHRGPHLRSLWEACPLGRAPWKWIRPRRMGVDQGHLAHIPGPPPSLHPPGWHVVLSHATVCTPRVGLTYRMGMPAVLDLPPPLGSPVRRLRPARQLAAGPQPAGVPGLPRTVGGGVKVPGAEVLLGGAGGPCGGELRPPPRRKHVLHCPVRPPPVPVILNLLASQIPTLRRVPIAASSCCARALTCLL